MTSHGPGAMVLGVTVAGGWEAHSCMSRHYTPSAITRLARVWRGGVPCPAVRSGRFNSLKARGLLVLTALTPQITGGHGEPLLGSGQLVFGYGNSAMLLNYLLGHLGRG